MPIKRVSGKNECGDTYDGEEGSDLQYGGSDSSNHHRRYQQHLDNYKDARRGNDHQKQYDWRSCLPSNEPWELAREPSNGENHHYHHNR